MSIKMQKAGNEHRLRQRVYQKKRLKEAVEIVNCLNK